MKKISEPIVFFGSGPVAADSLRLLAENFEIEAVVTKPRPLHHKGDVPVLRLAENLNLQLITASDRATLNEAVLGQPLKSRAAILIDFGIIVSQEIISYFPLGIINSHFSLLPEWRGADPITFAILSGQEQTGVSLMLLVEAMDEGPLIGHQTYKIKHDETTATLTSRLIKISNQLLTAQVPQYLRGAITPYAQGHEAAPSTEVSYSRKLNKGDGVLHWTKPAIELEREIRAFVDWPKSRGKLGKLEVVVLQARVIDKWGAPGDTTIVDKLPVVYCGDRALALKLIKPIGKKEMTGESFLAGYKKLFLDKAS